MPLKSSIEDEVFQVYFCTRAKKDVSVNYDVRPETCILRSLSMFFYVRSCHVEDVRHIKTPTKLQSITQLFIYHVTTHNLRSQIFRRQLLMHLENNVRVVFLRGAELDFPSMYSFFPTGCTIELKSKLKYLHETATTVSDGCFENAAIELIRNVKRIQERTQGQKQPHTFPIIYNNALAAFTFDLTANDVNIESVMKVSGLNKIAVKLRKKTADGGKVKGERCKQDKQKGSIAQKPDIPLSVAGIELTLRKTVFESSQRAKSSKEYLEKEKLNDLKCKKKFHKKLCMDVADKRREKKSDLGKEGVMTYPTLSSSCSSCSLAKTSSTTITAATTVSPRSSLSSTKSDTPSSSNVFSFLVKDLSSSTSIKQNYQAIELQTVVHEKEVVQKKESVEEVTAKEVEILSKAFADDCQFEFTESRDNEFIIHQSRTYAVCIPGKWGDSGEKLIYIKFPEESNQLAANGSSPAFDLPCSGFSTPSTFNLSEEFESPIESPLVSIQYQQQKQQRNIYPDPCPVYPLEASFPPVDLPVEYST